MQIISSEAYNATMNSLVLPFLKQARQSGIFERVSGQPLYYEYYHAMAPKGTLVLVHGFTEGIAKFREMVYYFLRSGLDVWQLQQREHGKSYRSTSDPFLVYIEDYNDLVEDLHSFIVDVVKNDPDSAGLPLYLMGHSMGGGVSACLLSRYPDLAVKAVLTSPMLEMNSGNIPVWAAKIFAKTMILLGKGRNYMPGSTAYSPDDDFEHACATSPERYTWWLEQTRIHKEYQMSACAISTALQFLLLTAVHKSSELRDVEGFIVHTVVQTFLYIQHGKGNGNRRFFAFSGGLYPGFVFFKGFPAPGYTVLHL